MQADMQQRGDSGANRKVSHAAIITRSFCCRSQYAIFARLVDFPTPLTPTKTIEYGKPFPCFARTSASTSTLCLGDSTRVIALSIADRTRVDTPVKEASFLPSSVAATDEHTLAATSDETLRSCTHGLDHNQRNSNDAQALEDGI